MTTTIRPFETWLSVLDYQCKKALFFGIDNMADISFDDLYKSQPDPYQAANQLIRLMRGEK